MQGRTGALKAPSLSQILGAISLIAGTAIGAAMLALPVSMGRAGFFPSIIAFVCSWLFMLYPAWLFLELCIAHKRDMNVISLARATLGSAGSIAASSAYVLLLYALLTAYVAVLSQIAVAVIGERLHQDISQEVAAGALFLCTIVLFTKGIRFVDGINRVMMVGLIASFSILIGMSIGSFEPGHMVLTRWEYVLPSLSIGFTSFGFHVVIPSLSNYLQYDGRLLKRVIFFGSVVPLIAYILWQAICLMQIPMTGSALSIDGAYERGINGAELLSEASSNSSIAAFAEIFALTAVITSFLGVALSMLDFIKDGLNHISCFSKNAAWPKVLALAIAFVPPAYMSSASPQVFFKALEVAGVFGVVLLLALFPACMVYVQRYRSKSPSNALLSQYQAPGGKKMLLGYMLIAAILLLFESIQMICGAV